MYKKILAVISFSVISLSAYSAFQINVPLAKKCYAIHNQLAKIEALQTIDQCKDNIHYASTETEEAAIFIADDSLRYANDSLKDALTHLRHAQVYDCVEEAEILKAEQNIAEIRSELKW